MKSLDTKDTKDTKETIIWTNSQRGEDNATGGNRKRTGLTYYYFEIRAWPL